jgi:hypothetical protein
VSELNNKSILEIDAQKYTICMGDVEIVKTFLELCIVGLTTSQSEARTVACKKPIPWSKLNVL